MGEHRARVEIGTGELGVVLDRLRIRPVQLRALTRKKVFVDRRPGQRVSEPVPATGPVDHQQLLLHGFAKGTVQLRLGQSGDDREQAIRNPAGRGRDDPQYVLGVRR